MYRIIWNDKAIRQLLDTTAAANLDWQPEIIAATTEVERILAIHPANVGEERQPETRMLIVHPIAVTFYVDEFEQEVVISQVQVYRGGKK